MTRGVLFSFCLPLFACNPGAVSDQTAPESPEILPLHTHDLQAAPGCYVSRATLLEGGGDMQDQMEQFLEMNLSFNMQHVMLLNRLIQEEPTAESWQLEARGSDGVGYDVVIEALSRGERTSHFQITTNSTTRVGAQLIDRSSVSYGTATPHTTTIDFGPLVVRWTDNAYEMRLIQPVPVTDGSVLHWEQRVVSHLVGCDPDTLVAFSNGQGNEIECWSVFGAASDCTHVNLWP
jgi:hypothetical protein